MCQNTFLIFFLSLWVLLFFPFCLASLFICYLFMVCLTTLSVTRITQRPLLYYIIVWRDNPLLDNGLLKHVSRQRTRLDESKRCPDTKTRFVATDETEKNRGTVRYGDFYEGRVTLIRGSEFVNSSERDRHRSRQSESVSSGSSIVEVLTS
jgi:hypothetical protein